MKGGIKKQNKNRVLKTRNLQLVLEVQNHLRTFRMDPKWLLLSTFVACSLNLKIFGVKVCSYVPTLLARKNKIFL